MAFMKEHQIDHGIGDPWRIQTKTTIPMAIYLYLSEQTKIDMPTLRALLGV
jgi:hypothetical protein